MNYLNDLKVLYCTWFKPHSGGTHQERLESFYQYQAGAYDGFRSGLLHGRKPMLAALAARLSSTSSSSSSSSATTAQGDLVWVDMGGGTGYNIELMEELMSLEAFRRIYIVDLTPSLCQQARERVERRGWKNVEVVEADVCQFRLEEGGGDQKADLVTFSYSLSMIPPFHEAVDNAVSLLKPRSTSLLAVTDFYTSEKFDVPARQHGYATRTFWRSFFELDGISLGAERRQYLDHTCDTDYEYNDTGSIPYLPVVRPPFYVWIGRPKGVGSKRASERHNQPPRAKAGWGFPTTFIYSMTWEDPEVDSHVFKMQPDDVVLSLTSGGCNLLDLLLDGPKQVVGVDLNPAQNHLVELKAVAIRHLDFEDFWMMFGEGVHNQIEDLFMRRLSPFLSQEARQFWAQRLYYFHNGLYLYGAMGWNVYFMRVLGRLGMSSDLEALVDAPTLEDQCAIWENKLRWKLAYVAKLVDNPAWLWMFNGVPKNQMKLITDETTIPDYFLRVFDQIIRTSHLKTENYFYRVCLTGKYTKECCPRYLKKDNFLRLKNEHLVDRLVLRTDYFQNVLREGRYTKVILMDHLDWLEEPYVREFSKHLSKHVTDGGQLIWRSASTNPWYAKHIEACDFEVKKVSDSSSYMDRVNMYASFWTAFRAINHDAGYSSN